MLIDPDHFRDEIAPARTFGFLKDVPQLYSQDLAQGGSFSNALVLDENRVINGPLRFPDEFVRHKILDIVGDFALLGHPLLGNLSAHKAGHKLHLKAVRHILENPEVWTFD
jgi:UDP-3-O-[3-hydroxymyristoyl] N-acetylglucosamine deacetylase